MSEQTQEQRGPLESGRGSTLVSEGVVHTLAQRAAGTVEGVYSSGGGGGRFGGSSRGILVQVGRREAAFDLRLGIDYGKNITQTVEAVQRAITEEVQGIAGLRVTEINATITDIVFPEDQPETDAQEQEPETPAPRVR